VTETRIRVLIVDDEPLARRGIRQLLATHSDVTVVGECRNGHEALRAGRALSCDLMFLDVQMPGVGGFEVIRQWGGAALPAVVFVTAYEEFAVRAFEAAALDYLVKPVTGPRFEATMRRTREQLKLGGAAAMNERLSALLASGGGSSAAPASPLANDSLIVSTSRGRLVLKPEEVDWIEARDYYSAIHTAGKQYLIRESLRSLERRLDPTRFLRVHRAAIVRLAIIRELAGGGGGTVLLLRNGSRIPVSRRRREKLRALFRSQRPAKDSESSTTAY
jgi:two-component system, LytTR family, response regulator